MAASLGGVKKVAAEGALAISVKPLPIGLLFRNVGREGFDGLGYNKLAVNSRRKSEVVDRLLMIAAERQAEIDQGIHVPPDQLTRILMNLSVLREEFVQKKARAEGDE